MTTRQLVEAIISKRPDVNSLLENVMVGILAEKLEAYKQYTQAKYCLEEEEEPLTEANVQRMGRLKLVRVRIRNGKVQRRKKMSAVPGYTFRANRLIRMSPMERRHRRMGARRAKVKRRAERSRIRIKFHRALMRRKSMGLR